MKPFEEFLFFDSLRSETCPCACHELIFNGDFQPEQFESAILRAIQTTPMSRATVKWNKNQSASWILDENSERYAVIPLPLELYEYHEAVWDDSFPELEALDVTQRPGIRFLVFHDRAAARTRILFQFHHATTDAAGANLFLEKVFRFYADPVFSPESELKPGELDKLDKTRWNVSLGIHAARNVFKFLLRSLNPFRSRILKNLWPTTDVLPSGEESPSILHRDFSAEESARIFAAARAEGVTLTEYLLARLLHASAQKLSSGCVRVAIPMNIRDATHDKITLSNIVSVLFLTRPVRTFRSDFSSACRNVHEILGRKKRGNASRFLLLLVRALRDVRIGKHDARWGFRHFLRRREPLATLVFSSLGRVFPAISSTEEFRVGNLTLRTFRTYPPRIVAASLQIAVSTYHEMLSITFHANSSRITPTMLEEWIPDF